MAFPTIPTAVEHSQVRLAVDQHQGGDDYPFTDPSADIRNLIADLEFRHEVGDVAPFYIAEVMLSEGLPYISGTSSIIDWRTATVADWNALSPAQKTTYESEGSTPPEEVALYHDMDLVIRDDGGSLGVDTRDLSYNKSPYYDADSNLLYYIHVWWDESVFVRVVQYTQTESESAPSMWPLYFIPESAVLSIRATLPEREIVDSIAVYNEPDDTGVLLLDGPLLLEGGYNIQLTQDADTNTIRIDCIGGVGAGRFTRDETSTRYVKSINGVAPNPRGELWLTGSKCYKIAQPIASIQSIDPFLVAMQPATLQFQNDCTPCCKCEDTLLLYERMRELSARMSTLTNRLTQAKAQYEEAVNRFDLFRTTQIANPLRVATLANGEDRLTYGVGYCNIESSCLRNVVVLLEFNYEIGSTTWNSSGVSSGAMVSGSVFRHNTLRQPVLLEDGSWKTRKVPTPYTIGGSWPYFWAFFDGLEEGEDALITFDIEFTGVSPGANVALTVDAYAVSDAAVVSGTQSPVSGRLWGEEPSGPTATTDRLVTEALHLETGLL